METNNRITAILARLREGIAGIYAQRKLNELDKELRTQDWEEFVKEIKIMFSDKTKTADARWKIKSFKQEKKNTVDFMIEFDTLAMKMDTNELHAIFFIEEERMTRHHQDNIGLPTHSCTRDTQEVESGNNISRIRI